MTLRDGRYADDLIYTGGSSVSAKIYTPGPRGGRRGETIAWEDVPLAAMPPEWLREMRGAATKALRKAR